MKTPLTTLVAIISGLIVLLAYFVPFEPVQDVSHLIINWAVSLVGCGHAGGHCFFDLIPLAKNPAKETD